MEDSNGSSIPWNHTDHQGIPPCRWDWITNQTPIRLSPQIEEKLRLLFIQIQRPFAKHCPKARNNFLSYPYCVYKFCQMLSLNYLLPFLCLLKGKEKLQTQEDIFQKICADLEWTFIPIHPELH